MLVWRILPEQGRPAAWLHKVSLAAQSLRDSGIAGAFIKVDTSPVEEIAALRDCRLVDLYNLTFLQHLVTPGLQFFQPIRS